MYMCAYEHILIYLYKANTCFANTRLHQNFPNFCCAPWRDVLLCSQARRNGATYRLGNEVTKLSILFFDGSHVDEIFASKLKSLVNELAIDNERVKFSLNQQDAVTVNLTCDHAFAREHIMFMNALDSEIREHGIAIVIVTDYRTDTVKNTIFVVCDDD